MRKVLLLILIAFSILVSIAVAAGVAAHWVGSFDDMRVTIDGDTLEGPAVAALVGGVAFFGVLIACVVAFAVVASVAIVIPVVLIVVAGALMLAAVVGLAPIAIPVLLVVGAYALLSRRAKRNVGAHVAPTSSSPNAAEHPLPHA
jgi:hypothetical protein